MGCSVVPKPHLLSQKPDIEFRFSFSNAELILFKEMIPEQRNCFIAFKALVKHATEEFNYHGDGMQTLSTYHLKTIFLWACETIEAKHWKTTRGWATCLLFLFDQLINCLENKSLRSYFITESNLLDGIEMLKSYQGKIEQVRMHPLECAAEFLDSMKCFDWIRDRAYFKSTTLELLFQCAVLASNIINDHDTHQRLIYEKERHFLHKLSQISDDKSHSGSMFQKKTCSFLASFANWCKEHPNKNLSMFDEMTLFDAICLENIHGVSIQYDSMVEIVVRRLTKESCSGEASNFQENKSEANESGVALRSRTLLILFSMNAGNLKTAKDELENVISNNNLNANKIYFDITSVVFETGYLWLFGSGTRNSIQEWENVFNIQEANVSAEVFFRFLLSICYKELFDSQRMEFQLEKIITISENNSPSVMNFEYLLLGEVQ